MRFLAAIILTAVSLALTGNAGQQKPAGSTPAIVAKSSPAPSATQAERAAARPGAARPDAVHPDDQQALREDLKKMRVILHQMETNLAFVDSSPSALKHQFQLEIDMWRTLIDQMERRLPPNSR
ncbi:MAG: hypothetical protein LAO20_07955 [Acidobacteriia bacterium]|nr:hypothetical protein [Terriglobia bacterium]